MAPTASVEPIPPGSAVPTPAPRKPGGCEAVGRRWIAEVLRRGLGLDLEPYVLAALQAALDEGHYTEITEATIELYVEECARQLLEDLKADR